MEPTTIPNEIFNLIGAFLTTQDLLACLRVSRSWHAALVGILWSDIRLVMSADKGDHFARPSFTSITRHAPLIRTISIVCDAVFVGYNDGPVFLPNLSSLTIIHGRSQDHQLQSQSTIELISRHNRNLTCLNVNRALPLDLFGSFPKIQQLKVPAHWTSGHAWIECFEHLWSRVQALTITGDWIHRDRFDEHSEVDMPTDEETAQITRTLEGRPVSIRDLDIDGYDRDIEAQLWVLTHCPSLVRLRWSVTQRFRRRHPPEPIQALHYLAEAVRSRGWSCEKLEDLELPKTEIHAEDLNLLLNGIDRLTRLSLCMTNFNQTSWETLQRYPRHLTSLREVRLDLLGFSDSQLPGSCIHSMLCSLPNLEVFVAGSMTDLDILSDDRPWVCRGLRFLSMNIAISSRFSRQDLILGRLSELRNLERCFIAGDLASVAPDACLQFTMEKGLAQLSNWNHLTDLYVSAVPLPSVKWEETELSWVRQHWPKLKRVRGISTVLDVDALLPGVQFR